MRHDELKDNSSLVSHIQKFVNSPLYLAIKDAFVSHSQNPDDKVDSSIAVCLGKYKGAVFVFNTLEEISKPKPKTTNQPPNPGDAKDRDLNDE